MTTDSPAVVRLRTGAEVPRAVLGATRIAIEYTWKSNPIAVYELVELARDPGHRLFGNARDVLDRAGLLQNGTLHQAVRDVVLASVEGSDFDMRLVKPTE